MESDVRGHLLRASLLMCTWKIIKRAANPIGLWGVSNVIMQVRCLVQGLAHRKDSVYSSSDQYIVCGILPLMLASYFIFF